MESDDDLPPSLPTLFSSQHHSNRQPVTSSSSRPARDMPGPSQPTLASQVELSQIRDGLQFLLNSMQQLSGDSRGIKRPAEQKPDTKERCYLCKKLYANKTTLFRHYRAMHQEMNPEKYHGCSVNSTIVSLDVSFRENTCGICGYVAASNNALDAHNRDVHKNVNNANIRTGVANVNSNNNANIRTAVANVNSNNNANIRTGVANVNSNNNSFSRTDGAVASTSAAADNVSNVGNVLDRLHKCEQCACYFEERNKLDEHMKEQHGSQFVCQICNKNLLFKDIDGHVKDKHPDVYKKNEEKVEKIIIEKVMKSKKGRVSVFVCTKCDLKMVDKVEAENHARGHKKGLKIRVAPRKVNKAKVTDVASNNDLIILTCDNCGISTGSYDAAVEHAQNHITNNSNDISFVTQKCSICDLKFEPLCYKKHTDLHYKNKEIHKESFKYFKYKFHLLLTDNWFDCFMADPVVEDMKSKSIYEHTRSVKMRVMREGAYRVYLCSQCNNFVEPTAVLNHTMNYDTCVKVKCSYACDVCQRKFNSRLARNNHAKDHEGEETFKNVLFNHENDKEFNKVLNDPNLRLTNNESQNSEGVIDSPNAPKVLYKCLCGLCFVSKGNADVHREKCPGKDPKKQCPKCNNFFNPDELLVHCFEHHLDATQIVIENFCPNVIEIESDEESQNDGVSQNNHNIIEIDSSDEDDAQTERYDSIKIEVLKTFQGSSEGQGARQKTNTPEVAVSEATEHLEYFAPEATMIEKVENDNIDEDGDICDNDSGGVNNEMTDDDSQDTISYENTETVTNVGSNINKHDKLKCVPMDLLLNPLHFEHVFLNGDNLGVLNAEITADIETVRQQIETTVSSSSVSVNDTAIKQEKAWFDPTDFSNIRSRRSLRQTEMQPASHNLGLEIVELLLTDDEETEMNQDDVLDKNDGIINEGTENIDMCVESSNNMSNSLIAKNTHSGCNDAGMLNDTSHSSNDITRKRSEVNHIDAVDVNNVDCADAQTELTNNNGQGLDNSHKEAENNKDYSDNEDDLFVPSGIENREISRNAEHNNNEKEVPNIQYDSRGDQEDVLSKNLADKKFASVIVESANPHIDDIPTDTEIDDNIGMDKDDTINEDTNQTEIDKEKDASTEHVQSNHDEETEDFVEPTPNETSTNSMSDINSNEETTKKRKHINIQKEFGSMNINIKKELIEHNVQETENDCDKETIRIKSEPSDVDNEYNENKENDILFIKNSDDVNYNHCSIC